MSSASSISVTSATYGASCRQPHGNVTTALRRACDGKSTCSYVVDYRALGDPAVGCAKDFSVDWRCDGGPGGTARVAGEAGFGSRVELRCAAGSGINTGSGWTNSGGGGWTQGPPGPGPISVTWATYGASCNQPRGNVTQFLKRACDGKTSCDYSVRYEVLGDPAGGCNKDFSVEWRCGTGRGGIATLPGEAGYGSRVALRCAPSSSTTTTAGGSGSTQGGGWGQNSGGQSGWGQNSNGRSAIRVTSATYGASCRQPEGNVTRPLKQACDGKSTCNYVVDYHVLGDPAGGCAKDFNVEWDCGDGTRGVGALPGEAGFNSRIDLKCPAPYRTGSSGPTTGTRPTPPPQTHGPNAITVTAATYGASCRQPHGNVTAQLKRACDGKTACDYKIHYEILGDPAVGCGKDFSIEWQCADGSRSSARAAAEAGFGSGVSLRCPAR